METVQNSSCGGGRVSGRVRVKRTEVNYETLCIALRQLLEPVTDGRTGSIRIFRDENDT